MIARLSVLVLSASFGLATLGHATEVKLPHYTRETLANGVTVDLMPRAGVPLVEFRVLVKGGVESEPAGLAGIAAVTAQLLRKGTSRRTADQFSEELDFLGGTLQAADAPQAAAVAISAEFLRRDFDRGLDLVTDAVLNPAFPDAEVRKTLAQRIDAAKSVKDNPQSAIAQYFAAFFFGPAHPYGHPADENTLAHIQRQDILSYHARNYCGKNFVVIVTGDFDPDSAGAKIRGAFENAPSGAAFEWSKPAPVSPGPRLLLIDKPDATQTYFYIGLPGIDRKNSDRVKLTLLNTLFGGRFTSMLNEELRVKSGLSYGAFSILQQPRLTGAIAITSYTKTETTEKALDISIDVLKRIAADGVTAEQLSSVKAYIKGTFPTQRLETSDQLAAVLGDMEVYGLGKDDIDDLFSRIDSVSLRDANEMARKYFKTGDLTFVLLGNSAKIRDVAKKYAPKMTEVAITKPGVAIE